MLAPPDSHRPDRDFQHVADDTSRMPATATSGSPAEVFVAFLRLGLTSFGGPFAHIGYFRDEFVRRAGGC